MRIGIRREDKNRWEARVPLTPEDVGQLIGSAGMEISVQPSSIRAFPDDAYAAAGARITEDLSDCPLIIAIKEIPTELLEKGKTYVYFAHVIKGQSHNMPMLRRLMELGCQLIDYEKIVDEAGRRLIFFGRHAGLAGMIDTLWALGQRLKWECLATPFHRMRQAYAYGDSETAKREIASIGQDIRREGLPDPLRPFVCGFAGYGNVSQGAQEVFDQLPVREVSPEEVSDLSKAVDESRNTLYKVVFKEEHLVEPIDPQSGFDLQDYYDHPEKYRSRFARYLEHLTVLANCVYWDSRYPRLVTKAGLRKLFSAERTPRLRVLGDITCDVDGSIECNVRCTDPGEPVYAYDPVTDEATNGVAGRGPVVLAIDNLPCELAAESSAAFGTVLRKLLPDIARADFSVPFDECRIPDPIRRATIVYQGRLTPDYRYLEKSL